MSSMVSRSASSATSRTTGSGVASARSVTAPVSRPRHRHRRAGTPPWRDRTLRAPTSRRRGPCPSTASRVAQCRRAVGEQLGRHLRGVHPDLQHRVGHRGRARRRGRWPAGRRNPSPRCSMHGERRESFADLGDAGRRRPDRRSAPPPARPPARRPPRPGCRAARPRRCQRRPDSRPPPPGGSSPNRAPAPWPPPARSPAVSRDHPPEVHGRNDTAPQRTADLRFAAGARAVAHVAFDDSPARGRRTDQQFQRIPGPAVGRRRAPAAARAARPASGRCRAPAGHVGCAAANTPPRCPTARATANAVPGTGAAPADRHVGAAFEFLDQPRADRRGSIEPSASMTATIGVVAATTPACTADPYPGRPSVTTPGAVPARHGGGAVGAVVVDDERAVPVRHGRRAPRAATPPR